MRSLDQVSRGIFGQSSMGLSGEVLCQARMPHSSETDHQRRWDARDKCSGLVHWEDPEELGGEGGRREDRDGELM